MNFKYASSNAQTNYRLPGNTTAFSARMLSTTPAVNYGRCMTYVTNVLILELIVYCALFVKEDKTGKILSNYNAWYLIYIMRA